MDRWLRSAVAVLGLTCSIGVGCSSAGESKPGPAGGSLDGSADAELDAHSSDTGSGGGATDASGETGANPSPEAGSDAGIDASQDAQGDAAPDASPDGPGPESGSCTPVVPAPDKDAWQMRLPSAGFGGIVTASSGGHNDVFLKSPTDYIRIGARLDWGGTVVFFGLTSNPQSNVIDANDTGRELQIALYDPTRAMQQCAWNASCQSSPSTCGNSITFLGWDPVQGGDECGHGAPVLSYGQVGDGLQVLVQPLQWNPDWAKPDCTQSSCGAQGVPVQVQYRMVFRFVSEHVVEVETEVSSQESFSHPSTAQEFPTLYVSHGGSVPDLPLLLDAAGQTVGLSTPGNDGFYYDNFTSPGPWVTWQNTASNYGVGIAMDQGVRDFQGWRGDGVTAPYFHNVRARVAFGLAAGGVVRGLSYLALGGFATVQSELEKALGKRPPFGTVDSPASGTTTTYTPGSPIQVAGWALDTDPVAQVDIQVDGVSVAQLPVSGNRPDVCAVYPMYAGCPNVGFAGSVPTDGLSSCAHLLRVVARDAQGNASVLGERLITP